ncbi:YihY/virulence factor BrkB family protein [Sporosarcina sp. Marseille-Q4943]|uniref:YihY/virulence factor BrkB family protein n=1 Tax=Sporosarcina sp. Marseille-Q4943 TaxID=2942204 RepID=UPI0035325221
MKYTDPLPPKKEKLSSEEKNSGFMADSEIMQFLDDVKDGDLEKFDVTTTKGFWKELLVRIKIVDITGLGSQLAFFFLLSLFPLLIFLITLLPFLNIDESQVLLFIRDYAPDSVYTLIRDTLQEILNNRNGGLLSIGALATIWSASKGMNALTKALNRSYHVEESRSFIVARAMSVVFTIALIGVLVVALLLPVFGQQIGMLAFSYFGMEEGFLKLWGSIRWIIPPILIFLVFSALYWAVPNLKVRLKSAMPGALFATAGWILTSLAFSFYVGNFANYSKTYGSIGGIIVLMMWLYFSAIILMLGGQLNAVMTERKQAKLAKDKSNAVG